MENKAFLKFFINEDLYLLKDEHRPGAQSVAAEDKDERAAQPAQKAVEASQPVPKDLPAAEKAEVPKPPAFKGGNKKGVLILVEDTEAEFLNENDFNYLSKIIGAVGLSIDDVALVNAVHVKAIDGLSYSSALVFTPNHSFSVSAKYTIQQEGKSSILLADPLAQIAQSVDLRKQLWGQLQAMFS